MKCPHSRVLFAWLPAALLLASSVASAQLNPALKWQVVVNNGVVVPGDSRVFNSYNQPSVNVNRMVVFRGRSKGGTTGEPAHGVFYRDMARGTELKTLFDRNTLVPQPNNLSSTFVEPPSFPRIDMWSNTIASRGGHQPAWDYFLPDGTETRAGTTGIYTNPFGDLIAGGSNLGVVPDFGFFAAPGTGGIKFDVFPGAPAITDRATLVFKGNYTVIENGVSVGKTGVYYRKLKNAPIGSGGLSPAGGTSPAILIANSNTNIPGSNGVKFGSTAPPSAAGPFAVFAGFDNEDYPAMGGIYGTLLIGSSPKLLPLVKVGGKVPGEATGALFNKLSEGLSYDGRFVGFWGAWGTDTKDLVLQCPSDGNKDIIAYCQELYGDGINPGTVSAGFHATVPVHQGIFVYDTLTGLTRSVAKSPNDFSDFIYWNFSGKAPSSKGGSEGGSEGGSGDDGEPARWRSAEFVAVSGLVDGNLLNKNYDVAFKARTAELVNGSYENPIDGIYLRKGPETSQPFVTVTATGMDGTLIDPAATYIPLDESGNPIPGATPLPLPVTAMGVERDGFRGNALAITVTMANEVAGWSGVYLTTVPTTF